MEANAAKARGFLKHAETLRKIADEMETHDPKAARSLREMAKGFERRARELAPSAPAEISNSTNTQVSVLPREAPCMTKPREI